MTAESNSLTLNVGYDFGGGLASKDDNSKKSKITAQKKRKKHGNANITRQKVKDSYESDSDQETYKRLKADVKAKQTQHISSLFAHNPDIPSVKSKAINPVCEPVFSNDLFKDCSDVHPFTVKNLEENFGVTQLTTVQKLALPVLMSGADALVRSQTGSGKTLAYAVPIVEALRSMKPKLTRADGIRAIIVLPTRELALQTYECFVKLLKSFTWVVPGLVVGGEKRKSEKARLRKGINVLVGTPGRLNDHAQHTQSLRLGRVTWLVLDEADRLLDLGYEKEITSLVQKLDGEQEPGGGRRQTVLLSATLTPRVEQLAGLALSEPRRLDASDTRDAELVIPQALAQYYLVTPAKLRLVTLTAFLHWKCQVCMESKMLIFMATQDMVDYHTELLSTVLPGSAEYLRLHGSMSQHDRTQVFKAFKAAKAGVLLCTDVAARGLDLPSVDWIVQYSCPATAADYVHRVGRTARVGHSGSALIFLVPSETNFINDLQDKSIRLEEEDMVKCLYNLQTLEWEDDRIPSGMEGAATALQLRFETALLQQRHLHSLACKAYVSWVRFYATYPKDTRESFNFKELHLGHFAKSFALRDPPSSIGGIGRPSYKQQSGNKRFGAGSRQTSGQGRRWEAEDKPRPRPHSKPQAVISEFDSGLQPLKKKKKT